MKKRAFVPFPDVPEDQLVEAINNGDKGLERRPGESLLAYQAFRAFCLLGPSGENDDIAKKAGLRKGSVTAYKTRHLWVARVEDWWALRRQAGSEGASQERQKDCEARREALRKTEWDLHHQAIAVAREAIARWTGSDTVPRLSEISRILEVASQLGRLAAGLPSQVTEVSGNADAPIKIEIQSALDRIYGNVIDIVPEPAPNADASPPPLPLEPSS